MILVTHDMNLAFDVSDHVVFLHEGKILEEGAPQTLFKTPKSDRLRQFLKSTKIT
jgi:polar amino acid transport system ATP-binding protein